MLLQHLRSIHRKSSIFSPRVGQGLCTDRTVDREACQAIRVSYRRCRELLLRTDQGEHAHDHNMTIATVWIYIALVYANKILLRQSQTVRWYDAGG